MFRPLELGIIRMGQQQQPVFHLRPLMSELLIRIETEEYIYEEYVEA